LRADYLLLEKGANPTIKAEDGLTVLHEAAANGNVTAVKMLLPYFSDLGIKDNKGYTPLMYAKENDKRDVVNLLDSALSTVKAK
jgi:ankyrin repeat protein